MQVRVYRDFRVELEDPNDFTRFRLAVDAGADALDKVKRALQGVAELDGADIAWVSEDWLRRIARGPQPADWNAGFTKMLSYAAKHGWLRANPPAVRAHVAWLGPSNPV